MAFKYSMSTISCSYFMSAYTITVQLRYNYKLLKKCRRCITMTEADFPRIIIAIVLVYNSVCYILEKVCPSSC